MGCLGVRRGKTKKPEARNRETGIQTTKSVPPSGRAAQRWTGERRRKTRQNADRYSRPARDSEPWRSSAGRPPRGTKSKRSGTAGRRAPPVCGIGSCAGFFGSAQPTEERGSAPGRGIGSPTPTGHTRTSPFRKLRYRLPGATSTSGSGPTGNPERLPLLIWNSPEPAAGLAFGKAASRPVKPGRGSASRFAPPPHHLPGFRKGPLRREKRASESGPFRRSRKRPPTHPSRGAPAGRLPRLPLRFPAMSPVDPARRMGNQKKEPTEGTHPQAGRGLVPACSGRRDRGLSFVRSFTWSQATR